MLLCRIRAGVSIGIMNYKMYATLNYFSVMLLLVLCSSLYPIHVTATGTDNLRGSILSTTDEAVDFATVYLKGTQYGCTSNDKGVFHLEAPAGTYTLVVSAVGYETFEQRVTIGRRGMRQLSVRLKPSITELDEVVVVSSGVSRLKRSAFNAVAVDTKGLQNTTMNLSDALTQLPGMKLRESGGVGSDMQLMMDGFGGRHVKIFIDGVPQEGVGRSFGLNNIPVNFADRIEVYKGVVPVGFGTDALGGVINIVTNRSRRRWFLDASYSYGSFNTHKSYVNFGQSFKNGLTYEVNLFQNYSDNNYRIETTVEKLSEEAAVWSCSQIYTVTRFHDTYHNEAAVAKIGFTQQPWADRFMLGFTYSQMYKDIQTGVVQEVVFGGKYRKGHSLMPSIEYRKRDFLLKRLDATFTLNYNRNISLNVDTAAFKYNWFGQRQARASRGEQGYQYNTNYNDNWNGTLTFNYRLGRAHAFTLNHVYNSFHRRIESAPGVSTGELEKNTFPKITVKNITGLSYRLMPTERWNLTAFAKWYEQTNKGPVSTSPSGTSDYVLLTNRMHALGYGVAGTYFPFEGVQVKLSYEKALRLPTNEELFGDEDLEIGQISLKPEKSDNLNLNLSYNRRIGKHHTIYAEVGLVYRNTSDFIQRQINNIGGGRKAATYINHGKVLTKGINASVRYGYKDRLSIGFSGSQIDTRDHVKMLTDGSAQVNYTYGARMPNIPYLFTNADMSLSLKNVGKKGNRLSFTYDNLYLHAFTLYHEVLGSGERKMVPSQFAHNASVTYSMRKGRYNISFECRNLTDAKLYDNFSLQKAGRAFYGKFRINLSK